jgi:hypothetical protein
MSQAHSRCIQCGIVLDNKEADTEEVYTIDDEGPYCPYCVPLDEMSDAFDIDMEDDDQRPYRVQSDLSLDAHWKVVRELDS